MLSTKFVLGALGVIVLLTVAVSSVYAADPVIMKLRVSMDSPQTAAILRGMGFEGVYVTETYADVFTDAQGHRRIEQAGLRVEVLYEDAAAYYAELLAEYGTMGGYKTLSQINAYLDTMIANHSNIVSNKISIGLSIEGRDIWAVKISDNPNVDEDEPEVFFNSLIHAFEPMTAEALLYFMDYLTGNYGVDPQATWTVDNREVWFVLVVNPDGYVYNEITYPDGGGTWRKNRRLNYDGSYGVDLNRNFGYMWGYDNIGSSGNPSDGYYRGEAPFSEPETRALRDFILAHDFEFIADYHAPGYSLIRPWSYNVMPTPDENKYVIIVNSLIAGSSYRDSRQILANGASGDWHYGEQTVKEKIMTLCVEVADGNLWPDPALIPAISEELLPINLLLCRIADSVFLADSVLSLLPPKRPVMNVPESNQGPDYTVWWSHDDSINTAVSYDLRELQNPSMVIDPLDDADNWDFLWYQGDLTWFEYYSSPNSLWWSVLYGEVTTLNLKEPVLVDSSTILAFWTYYSLDYGKEYVYLEVATDGENFQSIPGNITTDDDPFGYNLGNGITGNYTKWVEAQFDLSAYAGQSVWIRFIGYSYKDRGVFRLDDFYPVMRFETQTVIASDIADTCYYFTDKPEGEYYYRVRALDGQGQWSDFSNYGYVNVVGGITYVCGDADGDGKISQKDVAYLIDYLHKGGPAPVPMEAGDADGDGDVDKFDISYLIDYLHKDGPAPVCP